MTSTMKFGFLSGVSALALGLAMAPAPATAFEEVNWAWNAEVTTTVADNVDIFTGLVPTGMVMLEDLQVSVGDINAVSEVSDVQNNQPGGASEDGTVEVDLGILQFTGNYDETSGEVTGDAFADDIDGQAFLNGTVNTGDPFGVAMNFDLGTVTVDTAEAADATFDAATELPEVISAATAVANNNAITSNVSTKLHTEQVAIGGTSGPIDSSEILGGDVEPAVISALSSVSDILNGTVDSSATAVANNMTVDLVQESGTDGLLMGDVSQLAVADVDANSSVSAISINSYTGLGTLDRAIVNSVATAVGNNKSISVSGPIVSAD